jgi:molecular chaperone GrpE
VRELERQLDELRDKLRQAESRATENLDRWQRAQADLANYRRRAQYEREELEKFATANLIGALLPVLDSFDRAWSTLPGQFRRLTWLSGVAMIHSQLRGTLERVGLLEIEAEGQPFDPALHEAVDRESGEGAPHVVAVLQAGYKLHERVLRPTLVKVGPKQEVSGPASPVPRPTAEEAAPAPAEGAAAGEANERASASSREPSGSGSDPGGP